MSNFFTSRKLIALLAPLIFVVLLLSSIYTYGFDKAFLYQVYQENKITEQLQIQETDLYYCTNILFEQIQGLRDDLACQVTIAGEKQEFFNQRESDHMVDVQGLYQASLLVRNISFGLALVILIGLAYYSRHFFFDLYQGIKLGYKGLIAGLLLIGTYFIIDFNNFWTSFHKLFFRNDLWLLDPEKDRLIQLVPQNYFEPLVYKVFFTTLIGLGLVYIVLFLINRKRKTNPAKIHVVLFEPEIPQNTGNIMRTCAAAGFHLHIIEPTSFILNEKKLKRSSMDYTEHLEMTVHDDLNAFMETVDGTIYYITRYGKRPTNDYDFSQVKDNIYLMFGKESTGLPLDLLKNNFDHLIRIPMHPQARSLNLSNSVAIVGYEVLRQLNYPNLSYTEVQKGEDFLENNHFS